MGHRTRKISKSLFWVVVLGTIAGVSAGVGVLSVILGMVYFGDDSQLKKSTIMARINEETAIYMLDGESQIGSIFSSAHRRYVPINEVPAHMINAIIASEDKNFYTHSGVDPFAIIAAGVGYIKSGRMRGASTLTQQTVRNILGWWEVSFSRKFREWIAALQLERLYDKRQILEFYLNQFYVSGNGNGIGIAARYYFNKDVQDLDLVESAFIAGSVKGPSSYDPFIKFTKESRERAIKRAYHRKNYVLKRMYEQGWITEEQFREAWDKPVKFNRGRFRSDEVALVQLIRNQMEREEILEALGIDDVRELSRAGLKIYTTIDRDIQSGAQLSMRRNLSRLDSILKGFKTESPDRFSRLRTLQVNDFYYAKVEEVAGTAEKPEIKITFGLPGGVIPHESLMRYAKWLDLSEGRGWQRQLKDLVKKVKPGDVLFVEVKEYDSETHQAVAELHKRPRVNGGMIVLDKGEVRAVVSGFDTKGFNRAISAKRQPGSVFKPVVYFGALQLGWSILDRLDNERQIFPFQGKFYYPRPDHQSPYGETSMLWAGIVSENLASINLASRLVEKLNLEQFKELMGTIGLLPKAGEAPRDYHYRVARKVGVQLDNAGVKEFQLKNAISDLLLDVQYTSRYEFQSKLKKMWWGRGYKEETRVLCFADPDELSVQRKALRIGLLHNNFQRLKELDQNLIEDWRTIEALVDDRGYESAYSDPSVQHILARFRVLPGTSSKPALGYGYRLEGEWPEEDFLSKRALEDLLAPRGRALNPLDMQAIWGGHSFFGTGAEISLTDVRLDSWLPHGYFAMLSDYVERHYQDVMGRQVKYDLNRYWQHHDFRIALGLEYLVSLVKAMGVTSDVEAVLSFPLGTNAISVAEVAKIYQTFIDGKIYQFYKNGPSNQLNFIKRIEDRYGNTLFEPERKEITLVRPEYAMQMREILRRVVTHGTGRRARGELYLTLGDDEDENGKKTQEKRIRIPVFGKTGTTNDYTNAYFAGFVPYPKEKGAPLDPSNSYVLAAYAGYDLNKKMQKNFYRVSGAQGALPAWIGLAKEIIEDTEYEEMVDTLDLSVISRHEWPLSFGKGTRPIMVDMPRGVVLYNSEKDQEQYGTTDIDTEGESRFDEFRANTVKASIYMPLGDSGSVARFFSPFRLPEGDEYGEGEELSSSKILPSRSSTRLSEKKPTRSETSGMEVRVYDENGNRLLPPPQPEDRIGSDSNEDRLESDASATETAADPDDENGNERSYEDIFKRIDEETRQPDPEVNPVDRSDPGFVEDELW